MAYTSYGANAILDDVFKNGNKIALGTSQDASTFVEVSGGGYERYTIQTGDFPAASSGSISNAKRIRFAECTSATWGEITQIGVYNGGVLYYWASVTTPQTVNYEELCKFNKGALRVTVTTN